MQEIETANVHTFSPEEITIDPHGNASAIVVIDRTPSPETRNISFAQGIKKAVSVAVPMALSYTFSFEVFASGAMIGRLNNSEEQKAAVTLVSTFMNTSVIIFMSPLFSMPVLLSNRLGDYREAIVQGRYQPHELASKRQRIGVINRSGLTIAAVMSVPCFLSLYYSKFLATTVFGQSPLVATIAQSYLRPYAFAVPGVLAKVVFEQIMFTGEKVKHAMVAGLLTFSLGTVLANYLASQTHVPTLSGARGIALGYVVESYLIASIYAAYLRWHPDFRAFNFFRLTGYDAHATQGVMRQLLSWAAPISFNFINELLMTFTIGMLAGRINPSSQAAMSYMMEYLYLVFIPTAAFGIASQQEVGREIGAKCYRVAAKLARAFLASSLLMLGPPTAVVALRPQLLQPLLGESSQAIADQVQLLAPIMSIGVLADAGRYTMLQELRAVGDPWVPPLLSNAGLWLGMLAAYFLSTDDDLGIYGVGIGYSTGLTLATLLLVYRWCFYTGEEQIVTANHRLENPPRFSDSCRCLAFFRRAEDKQQLLEEAQENSLVLTERRKYQK